MENCERRFMFLLMITARNCLRPEARPVEERKDSALVTGERPNSFVIRKLARGSCQHDLG